MMRSVGLLQRWGIVGRMGGCKLAVVMALLSVGSVVYAAPVRLRVEQRTNPLGIDVVRPVFSWQSDAAERDWKQVGLSHPGGWVGCGARAGEGRCVGQRARRFFGERRDCLWWAGVDVAAEVLLDCGGVGWARYSGACCESCVVGDGAVAAE